MASKHLGIVGGALALGGTALAAVATGVLPVLAAGAAAATGLVVEAVVGVVGAGVGLLTGRSSGAAETTDSATPEEGTASESTTAETVAEDVGKALEVA